MRRNIKIAIIDYQLSNLFSVKHACEFVGLNAQITSDPKLINKADGVILPGMGAFGDAMKNLKKLGLVRPICKHINTGKPFLGVCLGQQLIFEESEEFGRHKGLAIIKGSVKKIPNKIREAQIKIPHVGWNKILKKNNKTDWHKTLLSGIKEGEFMYFVHSYYVSPKNKVVSIAKTNYEGFEFCSVVNHKNVFATQFHPEKSGKEGIKIYKNFAKSVETDV